MRKKQVPGINGTADKQLSGCCMDGFFQLKCECDWLKKRPLCTYFLNVAVNMCATGILLVTWQYVTIWFCIKEKKLLFKAKKSTCQQGCSVFTWYGINTKRIILHCCLSWSWFFTERWRWTLCLSDRSSYAKKRVYLQLKFSFKPLLVRQTRT